MSNFPQSKQHPPEVDRLTMRLSVGVIAITLGPLVWFSSEWFNRVDLDSISAGYGQVEWPRNIFVGFLIAVATLMLSYNGKGAETYLSRPAAVAAAGVAFFDYKHHVVIHYLSTSAVFALLTVFAVIYALRARAKELAADSNQTGTGRFARRRKNAYWFFAVLMILSAGMLLMYAITQFQESNVLTDKVRDFVLIFEITGLTAFGLSWLLASHLMPWFDQRGERYGDLIARRRNADQLIPAE